MIERAKNKISLLTFPKGKRKHLLLSLVCLLSVTMNIYLVAYYFLNRSLVDQSYFISQQQKKYPLLATRILNENPVDVLINFLTLRSDLTNETAPWGDNFGVYFEYLPTGTSININGTSQFHAASLFKTPVVMAYYHTKERLHETNDPIATIEPQDLDNQFGDLWKKGAGYKLPLSEVVKIALEDSDNTAAKILVRYIGTVDFEAVYQGLDINLDVDKQGAVLTPKSYSSILKALYFSSVLNKDDSQIILNYLSNTSFPDKLEAGIPNGVTVAHKIGDFNLNDSDRSNDVYSDCGIVYVPRRPYLLCMISRTDEQTARVRMQDISKIIYDYISSI